MNGIGIGLSVAVGAGIGARLIGPDIAPIEMLATMLFYGMVIGFVFHLYQWALRGARVPFNRR